MPTSISISYNDLECAFEWVSSNSGGENAAYISKTDGKIYYASELGDVKEDIPEDVEEPNLYWIVPDKYELDLGQELVMRFVEQELPDEWQAVRAFFRSRGAYGRFKDLLTRRGQVQNWYDFEHREPETALRAWAADNELAVTPQNNG